MSETNTPQEKDLEKIELEPQPEEKVVAPVPPTAQKTIKPSKTKRKPLSLPPGINFLSDHEEKMFTKASRKLMRRLGIRPGTRSKKV